MGGEQGRAEQGRGMWRLWKETLPVSRGEAVSGLGRTEGYGLNPVPLIHVFNPQNFRLQLCLELGL